MDLGLQGARALVTGGARGIGAGVCRALAAEGARVYVGYRASAEGPALAAEIGGDAVQVDIADDAAVRAAIAPLGPIEILINNAGRDDMAFFTEYSWERRRRLLEVNLEGMMNCTHAVLPAMQEAGYGRIVNIGSEAGRLGSKRGSVYAAAKGGQIALTKSLARENARFGITVNAVLPGPIETPALDEVRDGPRGAEVVEAMRGMTLVDRLGTIDEVAPAVVFLSSKLAGYITGEVLGVSGGAGAGG